MGEAIIRFPRSESDYCIGMCYNKMCGLMTTVLTKLLEEGYLRSSPDRYMRMIKMHEELRNAEADCFGFTSWEDLVKWQGVHGGILGEIET